MIATTPEAIGLQLRERRKELGLTQSELAEQLGTTRQWVSRLEKGVEGATIQRLLNVCDELDLVFEIRLPSKAPASNKQQHSLVPAEALHAIQRSVAGVTRMPGVDLSNVIRFNDHFASAVQDIVQKWATLPEPSELYAGMLQRETPANKNITISLQPGAQDTDDRPESS